MTPVDPCIDLRQLPAGSRARVMGQGQDDYIPLPAVRTPLGQVVTRWTLTDEERKAILLGADLYLTILSGGSIHPVILSVGPHDILDTEEWIATVHPG